jgi:hypothetical protein
MGETATESVGALKGAQTVDDLGPAGVRVEGVEVAPVVVEPRVYAALGLVIGHRTDSSAYRAASGVRESASPNAVAGIRAIFTSSGR